jgi:integrase
VRKVESVVLKDGVTRRWRVRFRRNGGTESSETFPGTPAGLAHAEKFAAILGNGKPADVQEALDWLANKRPAAPKVAPLTFAAHFDRYVNELTGVTSRTRDDYRAIHRRYLTHLDTVPIGQVGRTHITALVNGMEDRGLSPKTIKNTVNMLSSALALAVDDGLLARNPTRRVKLPKQRLGVDDSRGDIFLTYEEFGRLYEATPEHYQPLIALLVGTGLRWSEATALQWQHVRLDAGTIRVRQAWKRVKGGTQLGPPKTEKGLRTVNAATMALLALAERGVGKPSEFVFTTPGGLPVRHANFHGRIWLPACERAGLTDPRPKIKDLRSTHASWLISDGVKLEAVQDQLGHESIETTRRVYARLLPAVGVETGRAASAAMERALAGTPKELEA